MCDNGDACGVPRHTLSSKAEPFVPSFLRSQALSASATPDHGPATNQTVTPPFIGVPPTSTQQQRQQNDSAPSQGVRRVRGGDEGRHSGNRRGACSNAHAHRGRQESLDSDGGGTQRAATSMLTTAAFGSLLDGMPDDEVDVLMQSMPPEVQQLYDTHVTHYTRLQQGGRNQRGATGRRPGNGGGASQSSIMRAALATFGDLTQEQLVLLESFLWQMGEEDEISLYRSREDGGAHEMYDGMTGNDGIFLNADDGLKADEEEWLLEQMMAAETGAPYVPPQSKKQ